MALSRIKAKGRREGGAFVPLPCSVLNHPNFSALSGKALKLLMDMLSQIRFKKDGPNNNGDITATWSILNQRGWRSKETLENAIEELLHYGFIMVTRKGGRHQCSLYAVTWWAVNECGGKLDVSETRTPPNDWKAVREKWMSKRKKKKKAYPDNPKHLPRKSGRSNENNSMGSNKNKVITPEVGVISNNLYPDNRTPS